MDRRRKFVLMFAWQLDVALLIGLNVIKGYPWIIIIKMNN